MKKILKNRYIKDILACFIIIISFIVLVYFLINDDFYYGSNVDWLQQHVPFVDYFRQLFYSTFDLFPDFAFNLGAGQNIYNFSYYGLLNPLIIISFFFPFIKTIDYFQIVNLIIPIISSILLYFYLKKQYSFFTSLTCSLLFMFSGAFFHTHRHWMFVNYMPFLVLSLYGVDRYLNNNKLDLLVISLFLVITSSYYYSIGGLFGIFIYYIYQIIKNKILISKKEVIKLFLPFILSILMSMIILLPTAYTLLSGRTSGIDDTTLASLLYPNKNLSYFLYNNYSLGLTAISLVALIYQTLSKKKENIFLGSILLLFSIFPIFNYFLNGTLYIYSKALIPLLPIVVIFIAGFFETIYSKKVDYKKLLLSISLIFLFVSNSKIIYLELFIILIIFLIYKYFSKKMILFFYCVVVSFYFCYDINKSEIFQYKNYYEDKKYDLIDNEINSILNEDTKFYRISRLTDLTTDSNYISDINEYKTSSYSSISNGVYSSFVYDVSNNYFPNINMLNVVPSNFTLFNSFMGVKYVISDDLVPFDSEIVNETNGVKVYRNNNVLPIGYASSNIITNEQFNKLNYPSTMVNLLNNIVVENYDDINETINIDKVKIDYEIIEFNNLIFDKNNNRIIADKNASLKLKLKDKLENQILFIRIKLSNYPNCNSNLSININDINNNQTCKSNRYHLENNIFDYAIYDTDELNISFAKNNYNIENIEFYLLNYNLIDNLNDKIDEFIFDKDKTKGDYIVGDIDVTKDGYFALSIPYDRGFKIKVDGNLIKYEKVNTSFIGFPISEGKHHIEIEYEAPFKKIAASLSIIGFIFYFIIIYRQKKKII